MSTRIAKVRLVSVTRTEISHLAYHEMKRLGLRCNTSESWGSLLAFRAQLCLDYDYVSTVYLKTTVCRRWLLSHRRVEHLGVSRHFVSTVGSQRPASYLWNKPVRGRHRTLPLPIELR